VLDLAIERVGDGVGGLGPDVDDLLIALAVGDDAVAVLLGDLFDFGVGLGDDFLLLLGMTMSTIPMEVPERVASLKPRVLRSSSTLTVFGLPAT
jgi:hypothetical protein